VNTQKEIIFRLAKASEYRDNETGAHIKRMGHFCKVIAEKVFNFDHTESEDLRIACMMHDVGKIAISDNIILKPGKLTKEEFDIVKTHTTLGSNILAGDSGFYIKRGRICALTHHEKWDGTGYPRQLKGKKIPLIGRIAAVGDVFDALTSRRPYKEPWSIRAAAAEIAGQKGRHFDPRISNGINDLLPDFRKIINQFPDN
ncbi:MAG TPA: HD domain-containing phosphohydrolase, partial [Spirochaetota bacterium]|nr:HD domain-containing phosphohydrolase [Spirochaetota bacterium]